MLGCPGKLYYLEVSDHLQRTVISLGRVSPELQDKEQELPPEPVVLQTLVTQL